MTTKEKLMKRIEQLTEIEREDLLEQMEAGNNVSKKRKLDEILKGYNGGVFKNAQEVDRYLQKEDYGNNTIECDVNF